MENLPRETLQERHSKEWHVLKALGHIDGNMSFLRSAHRFCSNPEQKYGSLH